jgi:hypothetical protein
VSRFGEIIYLNPLENFREITSRAIIFNSDLSFIPDSMRTLANNMARMLNVEVTNETLDETSQTVTFVFVGDSPSQEQITDLYGFYSMTMIPQSSALTLE